jgi:hypothetical protein
MKYSIVATLFLIFQAVNGLGETCGTPIPISVLPFTVQGSTTSYSDTYSFPASSCAGVLSAGGNGASDITYSFTPSESREHTITVRNPNYNSVVYIVEADCTQIASLCRGAAERASSTPNQLTIFLRSGTQYFIIVDGLVAGANGNYTLTVENGDNSFTFAISGSSEPDKTNPNPVAGENCADPYVVASLPFSHSGTTIGFSNYYAIPAGACPWQEGARGAGSPDFSYVFTPSTSGIYTFTLNNTSFDSVLSVVGACNFINDTCLEGRDNVGVGAVESFALSLTANTPYYIIVDGFADEPSSPALGTYDLYVVEGGALTQGTSMGSTSEGPIVNTVISQPGVPTSAAATQRNVTGVTTVERVTDTTTNPVTNTATNRTAATSTRTAVSRTDADGLGSMASVITPFLALFAAVFAL